MTLEVINEMKERRRNSICEERRYSTEVRKERSEGTLRFQYRRGVEKK